jgi:hypothetical protein
VGVIAITKREIVFVSVAQLLHMMGEEVMLVNGHVPNVIQLFYQEKGTDTDNAKEQGQNY